MPIRRTRRTRKFKFELLTQLNEGELAQISLPLSLSPYFCLSFLPSLSIFFLLSLSILLSVCLSLLLPLLFYILVSLKLQTKLGKSLAWNSCQGWRRGRNLPQGSSSKRGAVGSQKERKKKWGRGREREAWAMHVAQLGMNDVTWSWQHVRMEKRYRKWTDSMERGKTARGRGGARDGERQTGAERGQRAKVSSQTSDIYVAKTNNKAVTEIRQEVCAGGRNRDWEKEREQVGVVCLCVACERGSVCACLCGTLAG